MLLPFIVFVAIVRTIYRLQFFTANQLTPFFYSKRMFQLVRLFCGRRYTASALCHYGAKLFTDENYDKADSVFSQAIEFDSTPAHYWTNRGATRFMLARYDQAIEDLSKALDIDSSDQSAFSYRGFTWVAMEKFPSALDDLANVECNASDDCMTAYYRGHVHEVLHHWEEAFEDYLLAYQLDSTQTAVGTALARLQAGCPEEGLRDASKAIENATNMCVRTNWQEWVSISVLGAAYSAKGDFDNALKYATMAFELAPEDEKSERAERITQFQNQQPFTLPPTDPKTGRPIPHNPK